MADEETKNVTEIIKNDMKDAGVVDKLEKVEIDSTSQKTEEKKEDIVLKKESKSQKKDEKKTVVKDKKDEEEEEEESDEELPPGLLEVPLVVEGKREKKKVERLSATMMQSMLEKKKLEIEEGPGTKLGDIPFIEHQINSTKAIDLKPLHRVLYLRMGSNTEIKKNIRLFSGFTHSKESKEHEKRTAIMNKMITAELKSMCMILGLERGGTKSNLIERLEEFLMNPKDKGLTVKLKSKSKAGKTKKKGVKRKRTSQSDKKKSLKKADDESLEEDSEEGGSDDNEKSEEEEEEDEEPKKKKAKTDSKKKNTEKATKEKSKENGRKDKGKKSEKKSVKKPPQKKADDDLSDSPSSDSDDEVIAKLSSKSPPSNEEIKELVKKILDGADLEKVTMKTVVKQVYAKYPSFDLSNKKDFIKDTVREVIS
ncbi:hypothetical protein Btru_065322 [Bulinus truncatus]|nr:hypothetical protein Btru_065322 [Bulinus truncatus]